MKKTNLLTLSSVACALLLLPTVMRAGIIGSPHDFSGESWNIRPGDRNSVCGTCHQPHHADSSVVPLWIHTTTTTVFTLYDTNNVPTSKLNASPTAIAGVSRACLSCHDGTVAVNSYAGGVQPIIGGIGGSPSYITNSAQIGTDLTHTHPISFVYNSSLATADGFLHDPSEDVLIPDAGTGSGTPNFPGTDQSINHFLLSGGSRVECSSCHDVHNQIGSPFSYTLNPKLVKIVGTQSGKGSLLCRSCHIK